MDLLYHLTTFVRIADAGSISEAARSLGLSVAMASRHLRALEKDLGVVLVRRTTRQLALSQEGTELLHRARSLLAAAEEAREVVRPGRGVAGQLVLSLPVTLGISQVSPLFPALLERHPRLKLDLRFEDRVVDLLGDGVDLAIRAGIAPPNSPFQVARRLATLRRLLCASPAFLRKHGAVLSMEALMRLPCLPQGSPPSRWHFETPEGPASVEVDGRMRSNNVLALRDAAIAGTGIARLPEWLVHEDLEKKRLVRLLPEVKLQEVEVYALFHRDSRGSTAIRAVIDHLAKELPKRMMAAGQVESPATPREPS
jgi:DNA-binding transcriptional LysR family regulator